MDSNMDFMVISMDNWDDNCDNHWDIMARPVHGDDKG